MLSFYKLIRRNKQADWQMDTGNYREAKYPKSDPLSFKHVWLPNLCDYWEICSAILFFSWNRSFGLSHVRWKLNAEFVFLEYFWYLSLKMEYPLLWTLSIGSEDVGAYLDMCDLRQAPKIPDNVQHVDYNDVDLLGHPTRCCLSLSANQL